MSRNYFGSVEKLPSGRFRAYYKADGKRITAKITFATKTDARQWLATVQADRVREVKGATIRTNETFSSYSERWLTRPEISNNSRKDYSDDLRLHIIPVFGEYRLDKVTPTMVRNWHNELSQRYLNEMKQGVRATDGSATVARAYRTLRSLFNQAVTDEVITHQPCRIKKGDKHEPKERPTLSVDQVSLLANEVPKRYLALVHFLAFTSTRPSEATAIVRADLNLDPENPTVRINKGVTNKTGGFVVGPPKTKAGNRIIQLPPHLVPILQQHLDQYSLEGDNGLVFPTNQGNPAYVSARTEIRKALRRLGFNDVRAYDLRHTGQTLAAEHGASLRELMARAGHTSSRASLIYQHRTADHGREVANRLSAVATAENVVPIRRRA